MSTIFEVDNDSKSVTFKPLPMTVSTPAQVWPEPQPFDAESVPCPYPIDALPREMRAAVKEVQGFTKAPFAMAATCALSALAVATQARCDVARAVKLTGPTSLFTLIVASSGERKSTVDKFFTAAIVEYEKVSRERLKPEIDKAKARHDAWGAERSGLLAAIKQTAKDGGDTDALKLQLETLQKHEPHVPKAPRMQYQDTTPEALARGLAMTWPSASLASAEAGTVLGGHGMSGDAIMRNLSLLNQLWDGGFIAVDRRGDSPFVLRGARLSVSLQAQPEALQAFQEKHGTLSRGIGFWARFLIAVPTSTQGERTFCEPPDAWPCMATFNNRISKILNGTPEPTEAGFTPACISLSPEAKALWIDYYDTVESALTIDGEFSNVRDVAAKIADNAARVAACFESFDTEATAVTVSERNMAGAIAVVSWHLTEAQRFLCSEAVPPALGAAQRLERWMIRSVAPSFPKNDLLRLGPLRKVASLNAAIAELVKLHRVRLAHEDGRDVVTLNPKIKQVTT